MKQVDSSFTYSKFDRRENPTVKLETVVENMAELIRSKIPGMAIGTVMPINNVKYRISFHIYTPDDTNEERIAEVLDKAVRRVKEVIEA